MSGEDEAREHLRAETQRPELPPGAVRVSGVAPRVLPRLKGKHPELIGKELHYSEQPVMLMGVPGRTQSGAPTIAVVIRRNDGTYSVGEVSLRGFLRAADEFRAEFEPDIKRAALQVNREPSPCTAGDAAECEGEAA